MKEIILKRLRLLSLNPCFSGRWSASLIIHGHSQIVIKVLILVLVEDGLREINDMSNILETAKS